MANNLKPTRNVQSQTFVVNKNMDLTDFFDTHLYNIVKYASTDGVPARFHFYITKNTNTNLTKENGLLDLTIPVIPVGYDINSTRSLSEFVSLAKDAEAIRQKTEALDEKILNQRAANYANKMLAYIKHEIAQRYALAKQNGDEATMKLLSKLIVMQGFDFELYADLLAQPTQIVEKPLDAAAKTSEYYLIFNDNQTKPITKAQYRSIPSYARLYQNYYKAQNKFFELSNVLNSYETYDVSKQKHEATTPTHSIIARGLSARTNQRVKKTEAPKNEKTTDTSGKKPTQMGEE